MFHKKIEIKVICVLDVREDVPNLLDYIKDSVNEVVDGKVVSINSKEGSRNDSN